MKRIGIVGTRQRNKAGDYIDVRNAFFKIYNVGDWIVSGGCKKGGDRFADFLAEEWGIPILIFYPNWKKYGKGAGFVRNTDIAKWSEILIACVADDRTTGGTEDTIRKFIEFHTSDDLILV